MKKKFIATILIGTLAIGTLSSCGSPSQENTEAMAPLAEITAETDTKEAEDTANAEEESAVKTAEEEFARQEEANTYYETGRAYLYGLDGQEIDFEAAYTNFEKASELGKTEANFYLGLLYDWYGYPKKDYEKARAYYEAAEADPYAQLALGFLYYYGDGVEEDTAKAQELYDAVIAEGYAEGYLGSGSIADNNGDYDAAFEFYNKVLEGNEQVYIAYAMNNIGNMYEYGDGVEQDYAKAMEWYEKAANLSNSNAMNNIGYMYRHGEGVEQDYTKAMEWYEKAANLGNSYAMYNIGVMYEDGLGVEQDLYKAQEWYDKAEAADK